MNLPDLLFSKKSSERKSKALTAAQSAFESACQDSKIVEVTHQGEDDNAQYVAVVYKNKMPSRPLPYKLFAIIEDIATEVDIREYPQFAIKGRK